MTHHGSIRISFFALLIACSAPAPLRALDASPALNGTLSTVEGVRVVTVWGTPFQRGYTHGYLLARDIKLLIDSSLSDEGLTGGPSTYSNVIVPMTRTMLSVPAHFEEEMKAMVQGMEAALGKDGMTIAALKRPVEYIDILVINASSDRAMCSSFCAWGDMTKDGAAITGRNLDWHQVKSLDGTQVLLIQRSREDGKRAGWASLTWPGFIGCLTGMSDAGVTLAVHDVYCPSDRPFGVTPRGLILREAIETARSGTAFDDVAGVLRKHRPSVGSNVLVSRVCKADAEAAAVVEYDGNAQRDAGVTVRRADTAVKMKVKETDGVPPVGRKMADAPKKDSPGPRHWVICTNHHRVRSDAERCGRFMDLERSMREADARDKEVDVAAAWQLLGEVAVPRGGRRTGEVTHHSVVFEPAKGAMHVAMAEGDKPAPRCRHVTFDGLRLFGEKWAPTEAVMPEK